MEEEQLLIQRKRVRDESSDSDPADSASAVKRIRDDLLILLDDDYDTVPPADTEGCNSDIHELDSFMKSFEEELAGGVPAADVTNTTRTTVFESVPEVAQSHPELGFLLGASDDELGLPCSTTTTDVSCNAELVRVMSESSSGGVGDLWEFEERLSSYDPDLFGFFGCVESGNDFVTVDGIFDYSDVNFGPLDDTSNDSNNTWQQESLPSL